MIQINCTQCKTLLTIDEAFAGGVCRCQHCGTIQTVPKHLKDQPANDGGGGSGGIATQVATKTQKTLYQKKTAVGDGGGNSGTGLDDLANIVSSGLTSNRLKKKGDGGGGNGAGTKSARVAAPAANRKMVMILSGAGVVIALLVGIIVVMALKGGDGDNKAVAINDNKKPVPQDVKVNNPETVTGNNTETGTGNSGKTALEFKPKIAGFLGQTIGEKSVAYVIDCGQAAGSEGRFDMLRRAIAKSLRSLGEGKKFQVIFWSRDPKAAQQFFPKDGLASANAKNVADCVAWMEGVSPSGVPQITPALDKAFKGKPDAVMIVAMKVGLDDTFSAAVLKKRGDMKSNAKLYTFSINQSDAAGPLQKIANDTKGAYKAVSLQDLRSAGE
ncbi:MAG TPA: hypothetical protein VEA69_15885 [Tepidisphaeraceae bacterium]|nr:hypothetical protein [Tepidisphaeraceae bacterium]